MLTQITDLAVYLGMLVHPKYLDRNRTTINASKEASEGLLTLLAAFRALTRHFPWQWELGLDITRCTSIKHTVIDLFSRLSTAENDITPNCGRAPALTINQKEFKVIHTTIQYTK